QMADTSYTIKNFQVIKNKFVRIHEIATTSREHAAAEKERMLSDINAFESEEIDSDFIDLYSDLSGPTLQELQHLNIDEIRAKILEMKCAWCIVYYNSTLRKLFIGRDIFGRKSLVFSSDSNSITVSCIGRPSTLRWRELPYAQVSVIDVDDIFSSLIFSSYLDQYPDDMEKEWTSIFTSVYQDTNHCKDSLITVSRIIRPASACDSNSLSVHLISSICSLLPPLTSIAICFSGGVDSLLITHLLLSIIPPSVPLYLINVAFGDDSLFISRASDRIRSIQAFTHLKQHNSHHTLHLILVDVSRSSLNSARSLLIPLATRPSSTILDESIASVLHFAFQAKGIDFETKEEIQCTSPVRFMGSGADELFAGYARHRHRFERDGDSSGIGEECEMELRRIGMRNGGRDDRVAVINGIETKSPFLHDDLVEWANGLSIEDKADLSLPRGIGEKKIIREALRSLNAPHSAPKQAMQFGSGMVKLENGKNQKGSQLSAHLDI
ncbi:hypothetical protein PFISCL1PPCAC_15723, partial [Pristionchus fissidentatus]